MTNIDQEIRKALMEGQSDEIQELGQEQNLWEMTMRAFQGHNRWNAILGVIGGIIVMAVGIYALIHFIDSTDSREIAIYGALFIFSLVSLIAMKLWFWMEMSRLSIIREILRLELRIQEISKKLDRA